MKKLVQNEGNVRSTPVSQPFMAKCLVLATICATKKQKIYLTLHQPSFLLYDCHHLDVRISQTLRGFVDDLFHSGELCSYFATVTLANFSRDLVSLVIG